MPYRNKTYVCFDADSDIHYYRLMQAWKQSDYTEFNFHNAHLVNTILATSNEETIKRRLRERLNESKIFVVLIGENTRYLYKFVRWEIEQALDIDLPVICVNLNGQRSIDMERCPPILRDRLALHVTFNAAIIQHALETWGDAYYQLKRAGKTGPFYLLPDAYARFGL